MTEKRKRTSRKQTPAVSAGKIVDSIGDITAATGADVRHVILPREPGVVSFRVGRDSHVDVVTGQDWGSTRGFQIEIGERAIIYDLKFQAGDASNSIFRVGNDAELGGVVITREPGASDATLSIGDGAKVHKSTLSGETSVGDRSKVNHCVLDSVKVGRDSELWNCELWRSEVGSGCKLVDLRDVGVVGDNVVVESGRAVSPVKIGDRTKILQDSQIDPGTDIAADCELRGVKIAGDVFIRHNTRLSGTVVGARTSIGSGVRIGASYLHQEVKIGDNVTIGDGVSIEKYAVIDPGVSLGSGATIRAGVRVRTTVQPGQTAGTAADSLPEVTVHASAESWMLNRVADVMESAGQKRLDKRVLAKEMPTLVDTHCVKQLLRMTPPPDVATLREMAEQFACTPKYTGEMKKVPPYSVSVMPRGWSGMQVMGDYDNDVVIFRTTPQVLEAVVPGWTDAMKDGWESGPWQIAFLWSLMKLGKTDSHPGGDDPYIIGWARVKFNEPEQSVLCEELQTDLAFLSWNPSSEVWYLAEHTRTTASRGFVISQEIANLLTEERIVPGNWEMYVRRGMQEGRIRGEPGQQRVIMPTFTEDKDKQQRALMALAFWNAADLHGGAYQPFLGIHDRDYQTEQVLLWVAINLLGRFDETREARRKDTARYPDAYWHEVDRALREWPIEAAKIIEDVRGIFGDFYESALAGVLTLARKAGMKEVWVPDYETKYGNAAYGGSATSAPLEPPRSVYTDVPKKFGVTQVERLPKYMDTSVWKEEADVRRRETWPRVQIPVDPRGRRLLANAKVKR